ncbi:MAG: hypothetical protein QOF34_925 [Sphingomonadales bacterium]|nr:hypothetical protein [Sphingomonadales bacterium]
MAVRPELVEGLFFLFNWNRDSASTGPARTMCGGVTA